jgi:hypothetical protein
MAPNEVGSFTLPSLEVAEDAAAFALAGLIRDGIRSWLPVAGYADLVVVCRELLRGRLDEDYSRRPGGYCMKVPTDPTLRALGKFGARVVELSYTARDPIRAVREFEDLWSELDGITDFEREAAE